MTDLERAFKALSGKQQHYVTLFDYLDGRAPLVYSTARLREAFSTLNAAFRQNWLSVVITAALDRITLKGWDIDQKDLQDTLEAVWNANNLGLEASQVHEAALVTNESFVIAWPDDENKIQVFWNAPWLCHLFYESDNPRKKTFGAKWYRDEETSRYLLTLYYPDHLEYWATKETQSQPTSAAAFEPNADMPTAPNPYGEIPMFRFCVNARSRNGELDNLLTLQNAVDKLLSDMMIAAEYGAFKQRYIISNADTSDLKNAPNLVWNIPAGDGTGQQTSVGEFQGADLEKYLSAIDKLANSIAIISRTPKHYFYNAGASLSGEALIAMEAPLNKKVAKFEASFGVVWEELAAFILKLSGKGDVDRSDIKAIWEPVQSVSPYTEAMTRKSSIDAGIPLVTQLRREGWDNTALKQMEDDQKAAKAVQTSEAQILLADMRAKQAQQNPPGTPIAPMSQRPPQPSPFVKGKPIA